MALNLVVFLRQEPSMWCHTVSFLNVSFRGLSALQQPRVEHKWLVWFVQLSQIQVGPFRTSELIQFVVHGPDTYFHLVHILE